MAAVEGAGGVVVEAPGEASVQAVEAATVAAMVAATGAAVEASRLEDRGVCGSCKSNWRVGCGRS